MAEATISTAGHGLFSQLASPATPPTGATNPEERSEEQRPSAKLSERRRQFIANLFGHENKPSAQESVEHDPMVSELVDPGNWGRVQWNAMSAFRDFLDDQVRPDARYNREKDESDVYGILLAIRSQDPQKILVALQLAEDDPEHLCSIPRTTWTQIIQTMSPVRFGLDLHKIHRSFNEKQLAQAEYSYAQRSVKYLNSLQLIIRLREQPGLELDIVDYHYLLTYAARIGARRFASRVWEDMKWKGVQPDKLCFNRYMEALVWHEDARLRLSKKARSSFPQVKNRYTNIALFQPGTSQEIGELVDQMKKQGIEPDLSTYCVLMSALARDGHFDAVSQILLKVWSVDMDAVAAGQGYLPMKFMHAPGSPLYPTPRLFSTIAEVYGLANRLPWGFRVVDYISRKYDMPLKKHVWYQLVRWTWLQARLKPQFRKIPEVDAQQLTEATVRTLLETMAVEPYDIPLDLDTYEISFKNFLDSPWAFVRQFNPNLAIEMMESVRHDYVQLLSRYHTSVQKTSSYSLERASFIPDTRTQSSLSSSREQQQLKREKHLYRMTLLKWTKSILTLPRSKHYGIDFSKGPHSEHLTEWRIRGLPRFLELMRAFVADKVEYSTDTGVITLDFRTEAKSREAKSQIRAERRERLISESTNPSRKKLRLPHKLQGVDWIRGALTKSEQEELFESPYEEPESSSDGIDSVDTFVPSDQA